MTVATITSYDAVLLLGFGGPCAPQEIPAFLNRVTGGRRIACEKYNEVVSHYMQLGGKSPYNERTQQQADAIVGSLREHGIELPVEVAYRNAEPLIHNVIERLTSKGARNLLGIILAPHQSAVSWDKYVESADDARRRIGIGAPNIDYIRPYFDHPLFVRAHADRIKEALERFQRVSFDGIELIFTAHSIPQAISGADVYVRQFTRSAELIAQAVGVAQWSIAYQSRSGSASDLWLEPDVQDVLRRLPDRGTREAIVVPIGFLCDHVEVLYDLDIAAKNAARVAGVRLERATALNDHPLFIQMLTELTIARMQRDLLDEQT